MNPVDYNQSGRGITGPNEPYVVIGLQMAVFLSIVGFYSFAPVSRLVATIPDDASVLSQK